MFKLQMEQRYTTYQNKDLLPNKNGPETHIRVRKGSLKRPGSRFQQPVPACWGPQEAQRQCTLCLLLLVQSGSQELPQLHPMSHGPDACCHQTLSLPTTILAPPPVLASPHRPLYPSSGRTTLGCSKQSCPVIKKD